MLSWSLRQRTPRCFMIEYPELLVSAIIKRAVYDYKNYPKLRAEVRRFIKSDYFRSITDLDPDALLEELERQCKKM